MNRLPLGGYRVALRQCTRRALADFAHFDVNDVLFGKMRCCRLRGSTIAAVGGCCGPLAGFPVSASTERPPFDFGHNEQDANGDSRGHHENERHGHTKDCQYKKQQAAQDLIECIHIGKYDIFTEKSSMTARFVLGIVMQSAMLSLWHELPQKNCMKART